MAQKTAEINFTVHLDEDNIPEKIEWEATDAGFEGKKECHSMMVSLWDPEEEKTLGIDLWSKEMLASNMQHHLAQIIDKLGDTLERATKQEELVKMLRDFSKEFYEKVRETSEEENQ